MNQLLNIAGNRRRSNQGPDLPCSSCLCCIAQDQDPVSGEELVLCNSIGFTIAARDFLAKRGASDEHIRNGSGRSEQRSLDEKELRPEGCAEFGLWLRGLSVTDPLWGMRPPRALPQAKLGATIVKPILLHNTSSWRSGAFRSCPASARAFPVCQRKILQPRVEPQARR